MEGTETTTSSRGDAATQRMTTGLTAEMQRSAEDAEGTAQAVPRTPQEVWKTLGAELTNVNDGINH